MTSSTLPNTTGTAQSDTGVVRSPASPRHVTESVQAGNGEHLEPQHEKHEAAAKRRLHFERSTEQKIQASMSLSYHVAVAPREGSQLPDISTDQAIELAHLASDLIRLLNSDQVNTRSIARAIAYMRGEDQITAGQALRQARWLSKIRWRQPRPKNNHHNTEPNHDTSTTGQEHNVNAQTNDAAVTSDHGKVDKENMKPVPDATDKDHATDAPKGKKKNPGRRRSQARKTSGNKAEKDITEGFALHAKGLSESKAVADGTSVKSVDDARKDGVKIPGEAQPKIEPKIEPNKSQASAELEKKGAKVSKTGSDEKQQGT